MDAVDAEEEPYRLASRSWDVEDDPKRANLMIEIKAKLKEYDDLLVREREILGWEKAGRREHGHYMDYLWLEKPLAPEDEEFVLRRGDMVDLCGGKEAEVKWLKPAVAWLMMRMPAWGMKVSFLGALCAVEKGGEGGRWRRIGQRLLTAPRF